jgi:hypothetical protein
MGLCLIYLDLAMFARFGWRRFIIALNAKSTSAAYAQTI